MWSSNSLYVTKLMFPDELTMLGCLTGHLKWQGK